MLITLPDAFLTTDLSPTMSSALVSLVPVLDGTNYAKWARAMEPFLKTQKLWRIVARLDRYPVDPAATRALAAGTDIPDPPAAIVTAREEWNATNDLAVGN